jgi:iron-sulfur cluster assembly accessory protein
MIALTDAAVVKVKELMEAQGREGHGLRVYVAGGGCSGFRYGMALEETADEEDQVLEFGGLKVFLDPQSIHYLEGANVDYVETMMGAGFKVDNPQAVSTCGCGHSFKAE